MGILEERTRKRNRRRNLQKILLRTVATAGFVSFALLAPNALQALQKLGFINPKSKYRDTTSINRARGRLIQSGLITRNERGYLRLTKKGEARLRHLELSDYALKKPLRWDKKWRILIFDIRETQRPLREKIRRTLVAIGFARLQDSVWVYPYPCEDLIALLKADFRIGRDVTYIIAEEIEHDQNLRARFGLTDV